MAASLPSKPFRDNADLTSPTCHYRAIFGEGDKENRFLQTVTRFGEVSLDRNGNCQTVSYERQEEIYFVVEGTGSLHYQSEVQALRKHDFTYLPPGAKHSISNDSEQPLRVLVMGFKIPASISIAAPMAHAKVANLAESRNRRSAAMRIRFSTNFSSDCTPGSET